MPALRCVDCEQVGILREALSHLPYPIVYVEAPGIEVSGSNIYGQSWSRPAYGFLAYIDFSLKSGNKELALVYLREPDKMGLRRNLVSLDLSLGTLDECVAEVVESDAEDLGWEAPLEAAELFKRCTAQALNLLLYVISEEEDAEVVYSPPKASRGAKVGKRTNQETVTQLGAVMGRRIGEARKAYAASTSGEGKGTAKAPHIRRAHWHCYWTGQRKGRTDGRKGDKLVVKWIPPIEVNGKGGAVETIHC